MKNKKILLFILCLPVLFPLQYQARAQGIEIAAGGTIEVTGAATIELNNQGFVNNGSYTKGAETVTFSGTAANTISGSSNTGLYNLSVTNTGGITSQLDLLTTNHLSVASGSKFTINPAKAVTVSRTTTLNSDQCLVLKSDATGTASFIDNGTITVTGGGTARIERYLTPYASTSDLKFHFLSSPVGSAQAIQNEFVNLGSSDITDFYKWDETTNYWINFRSSNYTVRNEAFGDDFKFVAGKGYLVAYPAAVTKNFAGVPYTNTSGLGITCTNTSGGGWNLLGNPFPSSIDWTGVSKGDGIDAALYYYDNATPGYKYYVNLTGGLGTATQFIAPMQGFMVHAKTDGTKTVTMANSARTHSGQNVFYKEAPFVANVLNLKVEGIDQTDYARVCFYDQATESFDGDFDAYKLFSYSESALELYSATNDNTKLAINTQPLTTMEGGTVPVYFKAGIAGIYTITAEKLNTFATDSYISLDDKITGTFQRLNNNPVYTFTATPQEASDRFVLHFLDATSVADPKLAKDFNLYVTDGILNIQSLQQMGGKIMVTDMVGRTIATGRIEAGATTRINIHGNTGVYIVSVLTSKGINNTKIVVE